MATSDPATMNVSVKCERHVYDSAHLTSSTIKSKISRREDESECDDDQDAADQDVKADIKMEEL